jgi:hypothetical protein
MGQARVKLLKEGETVEFSFGQPEMHVVKGDRLMLARVEAGQNGQATDETLIVPRAVRATISAVVQSAFPQGMDRRDGRIWAAWLEVIEDDAGDQVAVTRGQVEWLKKHLANEDVKVNPALAQWREAVVDYVETLLLESLLADKKLDPPTS